MCSRAEESTVCLIDYISIFFFLAKSNVFTSFLSFYTSNGYFKPYFFYLFFRKWVKLNKLFVQELTFFWNCYTGIISYKLNLWKRLKQSRKWIEDYYNPENICFLAILEKFRFPRRFLLYLFYLWLEVWFSERFMYRAWYGSFSHFINIFVKVCNIENSRNSRNSKIILGLLLPMIWINLSPR